MTWRNNFGLKLYMDGKEVASDDKGKEINLELSTNKPNLCFGRDVQGAGHFAKFSIGSFSTFNTFLTPSMMSNVYTFFFRSGKYHIIVTWVRILGMMLDIPSQYMHSVLCRYIVWSLLCYCVKARDHCCVLCDVSWDLLFTRYMVHQLILEASPYVVWVCCRFSRPCSKRFFSRYSSFPSL